MDRLEETYARLAYETKLYKNQLTLIQREIEKITLTTMDLNNAKRTVESVHEGETLIPIGGGSYVKGDIKDATVLLGIGSGFLIEVDKDVASERMKARSELTREAINRLSKEFAKISTKLKTVSRELKETERKLLIDKKTEESASEDYI